MSAGYTVVAISQIVAVFVLMIGIVMFAIEIAHPGVFLLIPASVLIVAGLLLWFLPNYLLDTAYGPAAVIIVAFAAAIATVPYYRRIAPVHKPMSDIPMALAGEIGIVISPIIPDTLRGKVRVKSEIWSARGTVPIPIGAKVRVLGGEGVAVNVRPLEPEAE